MIRDFWIIICISFTIFLHSVATWSKRIFYLFLLFFNKVIFSKTIKIRDTRLFFMKFNWLVIFTAVLWRFPIRIKPNRSSRIQFTTHRSSYLNSSTSIFTIVMHCVWWQFFLVIYSFPEHSTILLVLKLTDPVSQCLNLIV